MFSFDKGFFLFIRAMQLLASRNEGVVVIGLAGPSGSGKTVFSEKIRSFIPGVAVISMDMYNDGSKVVDNNFDDPRLTDYSTLLANLKDLREGRATEVPIYDFKQSKRVGYRTQAPPECRIVCVEGIYALSQRLHPMLDLRVSVAGGVHFDLVKRVMRDVHRSGQDPEGIVQQITETVYPMYKAFIEPDLKTAHIRITNQFNPFAGLQTPTYILKSLAEVSREDARRVLAALAGGAEPELEVTELYDIYLLPPGEDPDMCQTWLRMRNKDGRYSLIFEEWVTDGPFIIAPRITFEVNVRILGGLMALGYEIAVIMKRTCTTLSNKHIAIKYDTIDGLEGRVYVQVQGKDRAMCDKVAQSLGMQHAYVPRSYIEEIQAESLTHDFQQRTSEELRMGTGLAVQAGLVGAVALGGGAQVQGPGLGLHSPMADNGDLQTAVATATPTPMGTSRLKSSNSFVSMSTPGAAGALGRMNSSASYAMGTDAGGTAGEWDAALSATATAAADVAARQKELGTLLRRLTLAVEAAERAAESARGGGGINAGVSGAEPRWWLQALATGGAAALVAAVIGAFSRRR